MKRHQPLLLLLACLGGSSCDAPAQAEMRQVRIGRQSLTLLSSPADALWEVRDVLHLNGTTWVLTASEPYVHEFGSTGALATEFGRQGDGPGELRFPQSLWPGQPHESLTVWDQGRHSALTFSGSGILLSSVTAPELGVIRADIANVTFGRPLRAARVPGAIIVARYDSGVSNGDDLWNAELVRIPDDGGDPKVLVSFARDLPGSSRRAHAAFLVPVPLWDGCPDGRVAVLDPLARIVFMLSPVGATQYTIPLPRPAESMSTDSRRRYLRSRIKAEVAGQDVSDAQIDLFTTEAMRNADDAFAADEPIGIELRCAPGRLWIQRFDGSGHPLGYGSLWHTVTFGGMSSTSSLVRFPADFTPYRFSGSHGIGTVTDSVGLQRVAIIILPPELVS